MTVIILICFNLVISVACLVAVLAMFLQTEPVHPEGSKITGPDRVVHIQKKKPKFHDEGWEIKREAK